MVEQPALTRLVVSSNLALPAIFSNSFACCVQQGRTGDLQRILTEKNEFEKQLTKSSRNAKLNKVVQRLCVAGAVFSTWLKPKRFPFDSGRSHHKFNLRPNDPVMLTDGRTAEESVRGWCNPLARRSKIRV